MILGESHGNVSWNVAKKEIILGKENKAIVRLSSQSLIIVMRHFRYSHYCITILVCVNNEDHNWMINKILCYEVKY